MKIYQQTIEDYFEIKRVEDLISTLKKTVNQRKRENKIVEIYTILLAADNMEEIGAEIVEENEWKDIEVDKKEMEEIEIEKELEEKTLKKLIEYKEAIKRINNNRRKMVSEKELVEKMVRISQNSKFYAKGKNIFIINWIKQIYKNEWSNKDIEEAISSLLNKKRSSSVNIKINKKNVRNNILRTITFTLY